ncbi:MAG: hypothetical protein WCP29_00460 [Acidobacteriota bacterium]
MTRHVDLLAVLYQIWGALALVTGLAILVLALGALAVVTSAQHAAYDGGVVAGLTAFTFFVFGIGALLWGGAHLITAKATRRRRHWARLGGLSLAVLNLFFLPFGTALALYAFWVLLRHDARHAFDPKPEPLTPQP